LCFSNLPQPTKGGEEKKELNNGNGIEELCKRGRRPRRKEV
jgi:hypothetical protein